jgi:hypothetical protein
MAGEKDFERRLEIIERGIRELEGVADPGLRATVQRLVQSIMELHGSSLERLLEIVHASGETGPAIIDDLGDDPLVSKLLLLHSLHPLTLEARVMRALGSLRLPASSRPSDVQLLGIVDGAVRVRVLGGPNLKTAVENAIWNEAPDVAALEIEGGADGVVGFVPFESLKLRSSGTAAQPVAAIEEREPA